jgi:hypothetical protein
MNIYQHLPNIKITLGFVGKYRYQHHGSHMGYEWFAFPGHKRNLAPSILDVVDVSPIAGGFRMEHPEEITWMMTAGVAL